jgi:hypothetical protein
LPLGADRRKDCANFHGQKVPEPPFWPRQRGADGRRKASWQHRVHRFQILYLSELYLPMQYLDHGTGIFMVRPVLAVPRARESLTKE